MMFDKVRRLEPEDYYEENGNVVFTAVYLLKRGRCCGCNCRHCPFSIVEPASETGVATPAVPPKSIPVNLSGKIS